MNKVLMVLLLGVLGSAVWATDAPKDEGKKEGQVSELTSLKIEKNELEKGLIRTKLENMQMQFKLLQDELQKRDALGNELLKDAAKQAHVDAATHDFDTQTHSFKLKGQGPSAAPAP